MELGSHGSAARRFQTASEMQPAGVEDQDLLAGLALGERVVKPGQRNERLLVGQVSFKRNKVCGLFDLDDVADEEQENPVLGATPVQECADGFLNHGFE